MTQRHYVRFARAIALAGTLAGGAAGCASSTTPENDSGTPPSDGGTDTGSLIADAAPTADSGPANDAFVDCTSCQCAFGGTDSGLPSCPSNFCCPVLGPLSPPDLPSLA